MTTWSPITRTEMELFLHDQVSSCTPDERAEFERIRIPLREIPICRSGTIEPVFAVGELGRSVLVFEDVEEGFEWCEPDSDGVIRNSGCSQASLQERLYELLHSQP